MNVALCPLRMKVVSANAASPSGAGSATGRASAGAARTSSATTAMTCLPSFEPSLGQPKRAGADLAEGAVKRLLDEPRELGELVRRRADDEGARHVRVAAGRPVARIEVEHDRLVGRDRPRARVVADGGLCSVRDDRIVGRDAVVAEDALDRGLQPLAGQRLAGEAKHAV